MQTENQSEFCRNRYYTGKMLTSSDFEAEQTYMNRKRCFLNRTVTGDGILCGLNVVSLDDQSVMIESGAAIDGHGREIVVESAAVKKLSAIPGFEELETDEASLCIRYCQEETQPVYSVIGREDGQEYEFNRIKEGYELFLQDKRAVDQSYAAETEFFAEGVLLDTPDLRITVKIPAFVCTDSYVKALVEAECCSEKPVTFHYEAALQSPALSGPDGSAEIPVLLENIRLESRESILRECWFLCQEEESKSCALMLKAGSGRAIVNEKEEDADRRLNLGFSVTNMQPEELALRESGKPGLELLAGETRPYVRLADITLQKTQTAYLIEKVAEDGVKKYIPTLRDFRLRRQYESFFQKHGPRFETKINEQPGTAGGILRQSQSAYPMEIRTGIVEVPLGGNAKKGDICYSGEVFHGLGRGDVYVEIGYEYLREDPASGKDARATVYGNPELFSDRDTGVCTQTAVRVFNDKGSFMVAVKLLKDAQYLVLSYRYFALKTGGEEAAAQLPYYGDRALNALTPTVVLGTKESYYFEVRFTNMKSCPISYELTEPESGEITPDGIYTSPAREGVYEIRIYCTEMPMICAYAYAVVKKKAAL